MEQRLKEIYENTIPHNMILEKESVMRCMEQSENIGKNDTQEKYQQLRDAFEELLNLWGDFGKYNASRNHMEEDWRKEAGLL